ncbi:hypothetical protein [Clavibacter sp. B3I6]|uniref:hypothetical protein n=1 Tax=Clavibacter sp. B3I6 TaxID=3042268 RepID=UPI0027D87FFD|nr:hypothetical protein [Clavibacter sp. B3I6]
MADAEATHGTVGDGAQRVHFVAAVLADGTQREGVGDLLPWVDAADVPAPRAPAAPQPRRRARGF